MDPDPDSNVGHTDLSGKSDFHPAAPAAATPAVTRPGAGPSSAMVTRSRARGGREVNIEPEVEFFPEIEIPAETDEGVSGATRHTTDIASQYRPEVSITQEAITSTSITTSTTPITRNIPPPHIICSSKQLSVTFINHSLNSLLHPVISVLRPLVKADSLCTVVKKLLHQS